jgi:hypothetical protein
VDEARETLERALAIYDRAGSGRAAFACVPLGALALERGDAQRAVELFGRAVKLCESSELSGQLCTDARESLAQAQTRSSSRRPAR